MVERKLLSLFDDKWFSENIILPKNPDQETPQKSHLSPQILSPNSSDVLVRSFSDQCLSSTSDVFSSKGSVSPDSVLPEATKKLRTIFSGNEFEFGEKIQVQTEGRENRRERVKRGDRRERRGSGMSKSLSELEFEEIKGFMDLGFVFSEEDIDSSLASIIPGLQRLARKHDNDLNSNDKEEDYENRISRPYLSEAWMLEERKIEVNPLMNWVVPRDLVSNEIAMKNHLRSWAHTVASFIR